MMTANFPPQHWDEQVRRDWLSLVRLALREDWGTRGDVTTDCLVPEDAVGQTAVVSRMPSVVAGLAGISALLEEAGTDTRWDFSVADGDCVDAGTEIGRWQGSARQMLFLERILLNFLGHLSGIATMTRRFVDAVGSAPVKVYDTRKTTPGWRRLEKYAVRCGGGENHRGGLDAAVLIKDNHLAFGGAAEHGKFSLSRAVRLAREHLASLHDSDPHAPTIVEIEVDTWEQFEEVLPALPDIILLDNMPLEMLRRAAARRNETAPGITLEASGGVTLENVRAIAETGVDRVSIGAITHATTWCDFGLDWILK